MTAAVMDAGFSVDAAVLLGGTLLLVGVIATGVAARARVPGLLLFLGLGMLVADDGLALVRFDDAALAQNIAVVALLVILFEGGLGTDADSFRSVGLPAGLLATIGVAVTAAVVAVVSWWLLGLDATTALLLGSVVASTDAAAVFAALRSERLPIRVRRTLQLESGLNDPVAVLLTIGVLEIWRGDPTPWDWTRFLIVQLAAGAVVGVVTGRFGRWLVDHVRGAAASSLGVLTLAVAALSYGIAAALGGSGFLAVYVTGVALTGSRRAVRSVLFFHEGLAATAQAVLFLLLGILVFPSALVGDLWVGLVVAATLTFVARPIAVGLVLAPLRMPVRETAVVSWAGLRGAAPIVLATIPFTAGHPDGALVFDVAFVVVVVSVAVQAPSLGLVARRLGIVHDRPDIVRPEIVPVDLLDADLVEVTIPALEPTSAGAPTRRTGDAIALRDRPPPEGARVVVIHRDDDDIVPDGDTSLDPGDTMLMIVPKRVDLDHVGRWAQQLGRDETSATVEGGDHIGEPGGIADDDV